MIKQALKTLKLTTDKEAQASYWARYVREYLALGEAPDQVRNCFQQRSRWTKVRHRSIDRLSPLCYLWCAMGHIMSSAQTYLLVDNLPFSCTFIYCLWRCDLTRGTQIQLQKYL